MSDQALKLWQKRLDHLLVAEAKCADPIQMFAIREEIAEARSKIAEPGDDPPVGLTFVTPPDLSNFNIFKYAPEELIGREAETQLLDGAWEKVCNHETKRPHILTFVALGGEGKTSLVAKWAAELAHQDWPGCEAVFAWSFYHQGTNEKTADSSDPFLKAALAYFGDVATAESAQHASVKGEKLAQIVGKRRALLILDGLEPLQYAPNSPTPGELKDHGMASLLQGLAANSNGLCVVTTRYPIPDLRAFMGKTVREERLKRLSKEDGVKLLRSFETESGGKPLKIHGTQREFEQLAEDVKGHALTLNLIGSYLLTAHTGDIRRQDQVKLEEADAEEQGGHAFRVMDAYVKSFENGGKTEEDKAKGQRALALLQLLGLFDRPATADCLNVLWKGEAIAGLTEPLISLSEAQRNQSLTRLGNAKLLTVNREDGTGILISLDTHPLIRDYFRSRFLKQFPRAWKSGNIRLGKLLRDQAASKPSVERWPRFELLYRAMSHFCRAGGYRFALHRIYRAQISNGDGGQATREFGCFATELGSLHEFFKEPWDQLADRVRSSNLDSLIVLRCTGFALISLGRYLEGMPVMESALKAADRLGNSEQIAVIARNYANFSINVGRVRQATDILKARASHADSSPDKFMPIGFRCTQGYATLLLEGPTEEVEKLFNEALPLIYSFPVPLELPNYHYHQFLLAKGNPDIVLAEIVALEQRAGSNRSKFGQALRSLARVSSYQALGDWQNAEIECVNAQQLAAEAGRAEFVVVAHLLEARNCIHRIQQIADGHAPELLQRLEQRIQSAGELLHRERLEPLQIEFWMCRAWLRLFTGARTGSESAQSDLDEAWEIAERGPMPLFMADIHLHRARLFGRTTDEKYPWESVETDIAAAAKLINDCGYHRRDQELADAKAALL